LAATLLATFLTTLFSISAGAQAVATFQLVSGDRQIAVATFHPPQPFRVRALDVGGKPVPGANVFIGPAASPGYAYLKDEFGFRGFNTIGDVIFDAGVPNPAYFGVTDADGYVQGKGQFVDYPTAAFLVGVVQIGMVNSVQSVFSVVSVSETPQGRPSVVVEYFNGEVKHYFNTLNDAEVTALDGGVFSGWKRSIGSFIAYSSEGDAPPGAVAVCRFFSAAFTSHFYSADSIECDAVIEKWPNLWQLETRNAFYIQVPDAKTGVCGAGLQPVYRLFNNALAPNHRYVTDAKLRSAMIAAGWISEGYGSDGVVFCAAA